MEIIPHPRLLPMSRIADPLSLLLDPFPCVAVQIPYAVSLATATTLSALCNDADRSVPLLVLRDPRAIAPPFHYRVIAGHYVYHLAVAVEARSVLATIVTLSVEEYSDPYVHITLRLIELRQALSILTHAAMDPARQHVYASLSPVAEVTSVTGDCATPFQPNPPCAHLFTHKGGMSHVDEQARI